MIGDGIASACIALVSVERCLNYIIHILNTVEEFKPNSDNVKIYLCGPTVQSSPHIGHGRSAVVFDFLIRYLKFI